MEEFKELTQRDTRPPTEDRNAGSYLYVESVAPSRGTLCNKENRGIYNKDQILKFMIDLKSVLGLSVASLAILPVTAQKSQAVKASTPNIILILMDDMGYGDIGRTGANQYETPNLNRLANQGMQFTWYYCPQAVSSASRAGLMTGCYPNRVGISGALMPWAQVGINSEETTIAEILKTRGYHTGVIGKWHLGHHKEFLPLQHGFDEYFGIPYSNDMWPVDFDGVPIHLKDTTSRLMKYPILPLIEGNEKVAEVRTSG